MSELLTMENLIALLVEILNIRVGRRHSAAA